jgi:polyphosphate:AMP phosphotransferase
MAKTAPKRRARPEPSAPPASEGKRRTNPRGRAKEAPRAKEARLKSGAEHADLDRETFDQLETEVRNELLAAQLALVEKKPKAVLVLVNGLAGAGRGETVNLLGEWMDPRHVRTFAYGAPIEEENEHPFSFRFFRDLPRRGQVGFYFSSWYEELIAAASKGKKVDVSRVLGLEATLADNGVHLVKLFFDLDKKAQKKRFRELEGDKDTRWRVTSDDWEANRRHAEIHRGAMSVLRATSTPKSPWQIIDGSRPRAASLECGRALTAAIRATLEPSRAAEGKGTTKSAPKLVLPAPLPKRRLAPATRIEDLAYGEVLDDDTYGKRLERAQRRLALLTRHKRFPKHGAAVVLEGMDAAGKGGAIRRITRALDARTYEVVPIAAPTEEERLYPYLWRFFRKLPRHGRFSIFDRSWYGRVLVERVEGFATPDEIARAYGEIVRFEDDIRAHGVAVVKVWLAIEKDEQLRRFKERQELLHKRFKITDEDFRNRERWDAYVGAANDMFERTSTHEAPWYVVPANDKRYTRVAVLEHLGDRLEALLSGDA